jgi:hypothetical protein
MKIGHYLSGNLIESATILCNLAKDIEKEYQESWDNRTREQKYKSYLSFVMSSIALTGGFYESKFNELLYEIWYTQNPSNIIQKKIPSVKIEIFKKENGKLKTLTNLSVEKKYLKLLEFFTGENPINISLPEDIAIFNRIRNRTLHYEFEWLDVSNPDLIKSNKYDDLEKFVISKFAMSIFSSKGDLFFPTQCLGHGCAYWGIKTSLSFIEDFYDTIKIERPDTLTILKI